MNSGWRILLAAGGLMAAVSCPAQDDSVVVLSDTVTGNQEQPKVLYIVPWQAAEDNTLLQQPLATKLHSEVFEHVERDQHRRELRYLQALSQSAEQQGAQ